MREHKGFFAAVAIGLLLVARVSLAEDAMNVAVLTDGATSQLEGRLGVAVNEAWEIGPLVQWYSEDRRGADFGFGGYVTLSVNPGATLPLKAWFPGLGDVLDLPETIEGDTYLIGKVVGADADGDIAMKGALGAGARVGPVLIEGIYEIVEGAQTFNPDLESGVELWAGVKIDF